MTEDQVAPSTTASRRIVGGFDEAYWLERDRKGGFPTAFYDAMAEGGWLGITMPEAQFGGAGLGVTEAAIMMRAVADSPGAMAAVSSIHINIFGPHPIVVFGTKEQQARWLPDLIHGRVKACFGVTEPDAGLDTSNDNHPGRVRDGDGYVIHGRKIWTTTAQVAEKVMLLARTTPQATRSSKPTEGLTLFYTDLDRAGGRGPRDRQDGTQGGRFERVCSSTACGSPADGPRRPRGRRLRLPPPQPQPGAHPDRAPRRSASANRRSAGPRSYAKDRVVFGRPIGQNQAIQHPLAESWMPSSRRRGSP